MRHPDFIKAASARAKKKWSDPVAKERMAEKIRQHWAKPVSYARSPESLAKRSAATKRQMAKPGAKESISKKAKARWADPHFKEENSKRLRGLSNSRRAADVFSEIPPPPDWVPS